MTWRGFLIAGLLILLSFGSGMAQAGEKPFALWLEDVKKEAIAQGTPASIVDNAFAGLQPNETVVKLDRKQPEGKITFSQYITSALNQRRIAKGRALMQQHGPLLKKISARYHVPPQIIVALWGVETEYGANKGNFSLVQSLATLAYEGRRAELFHNELLKALVIMQDERVMAGALTGSWAGAMGHCQFMPSTYLKYAVDWNGDGHRDIWNSIPDALASIASYQHGLKWDDKLPWGIAVKLPAGFAAAEADLYTAKTVKEWNARGVRLSDGSALPWKGATPAYVMYPGTPGEGAWLVFQNYHRLLEWNRSRYFAHSVGMLSDALVE